MEKKLVNDIEMTFNDKGLMLTSKDTGGYSVIYDYNDDGKMCMQRNDERNGYSKTYLS